MPNSAKNIMLLRLPNSAFILFFKTDKMSRCTNHIWIAWTVTKPRMPEKKILLPYPMVVYQYH